MNKVAKNAIWIIACRIVQAVFSLIIHMLTARYLGPSNYGVITYASSLVAFVLPLMQLGFCDILVQEIVNDPEREGVILGTAITLNFFSSICCILGVVSFAKMANPEEPLTILVCFLYSFILIFQAINLIQYWFQAQLLSKYTSIVSLGAFFVVSIYKVYLLLTSKSVEWFAVSNAFDFALIAAGSVFIYRRLNRQRFSFSWQLGKEMFSRSKHYILSSMMVTMFLQTDKIMIKLMLDESSTGYYGAAVTCTAITGFIFSAIIDSFRPSIFEGIKKSYGLFENRLMMLYSVVIYLSLVQSLFMTLLAPFVVNILFGKAYSPAIVTLQIIVWYTTFSYIGSVRNIWILANNLQKYLWKINTMGALTNVALNAIMIPILGINGAALASLFTQFFTNVIVGYIIRPITPNNTIMIRSLNPSIVISAIQRIKLTRQ